MKKKLSKSKMINISGGGPHWIVRAVYTVGMSAWRNRKHIKQGYRDGIKNYKEF